MHNGRDLYRLIPTIPEATELIIEETSRGKSQVDGMPSSHHSEKAIKVFAILPC